MELGALSLLFALLIALPVGIYSGMNPESVGDQILRSIAILFICIPSFWLGTMILILPAVWFRWSPPLHFVSFWEDPLANVTLFIIPGDRSGDVAVRHHHEIDPHHDAGGTQAGLYPHRVGEKGSGSGWWCYATR